MSHGSLIGALRDGGLSRHADDLEVDLTEEDAEALQTVVRRRLRRNGLALSYDPRGRCFKVWPLGSAWAEAREAQLRDQSWWLPQQRVGTPQLDIYLVQNEEGNGWKDDENGIGWASVAVVSDPFWVILGGLRGSGHGISPGGRLGSLLRLQRRLPLQPRELPAVLEEKLGARLSWIIMEKRAT